MIVVITGSDGYSIAKDGELVARKLSNTDAEDLYAKLGQVLRPVREAAVSPAKARLMRYPAFTQQR